jgi:hypothetical protein
VSDEAVRQVEATFNRSAWKSVRMGSRELQMAKTTVWQVLRRRARMKPYNATLPDRWSGRTGAADEVASTRELQMSKTTVWQVLRRRVRMKPYNATLPDRWIGLELQMKSG